ncbi:MAG: hypothetical protein ACF8PN_16995 [Phycisphaerales bacterium]
MSQTRLVLSGAVAALGSALLVTPAAKAFPAFGVNAEGNCWWCHSDKIATDRMEVYDFVGLIDPQEAPGVPDLGLLKYFSVEQGGSTSLNIRALNGEENYAFQTKGFDDLDVTAFGVLLYTPDPTWDPFQLANGSFYFTDSDGTFDGYDWNTSDPTEVGFDIAVESASNTGYYAATLALSGRDPARLGWYQEEVVYLEVTANPDVIVLDSTDLIRGQQATLAVTNATPNEMVYFAYSLRGLGDTFVPQLGVTMSIRNPTLGGQVRANPSGAAQLRQNIPPGTPARPIWLQAAQTGRISNIIATDIQ